jgi:hypothetical protein
MKPTISLRRALADTQLLGNALPGASWQAWRTLLIAAMGEVLDDDERKIFQQLTKRAHPPTTRANTLAFVVGRRGGKSKATATLAAYIAALVNHSDVLVRGETGTLLIVAADMRQATIVHGHVAAAFAGSPILAQLVGRQTAETIELNNHISIECRPANYRRLRGATYVAAICDELCFWYSDDNYSNPDTEVLAAIKPGLLTTHGPLVMASSAYAQNGVLYNTWRQHFGQPGDTLVAYGSSRDFNPTLPQSEIDAELKRDHARNAAEYLSQWRSDVAGFINAEVVRACVSHNTFERSPQRHHSYVAFCDPSLGATDSMTLCIGHYEANRQVVVVDAIRETQPPFSPEQVTEDFAAILKTYRVSTCTGDRVGGAWVAEQFGKFGILYTPAAQPKAMLYQDALALLNSRRVDLLDHDRTVAQFCALERSPGRGGGRDVIDHRPGAHDDVANAVAGLISTLLAGPGRYNLDAMCDWSPTDPTPAEVYRKNRLRCPPNMAPQDFARISKPVASPMMFP